MVDIGTFISFFRSFFNQVYSFLFDTLVFAVGGITVSLGSIMIALIIVYFVINTFYKGAQG